MHAQPASELKTRNADSCPVDPARELLMIWGSLLESEIGIVRVWRNASVDGGTSAVDERA